MTFWEILLNTSLYSYYYYYYTRPMVVVFGVIIFFLLIDKSLEWCLTIYVQSDFKYHFELFVLFRKKKKRSWAISGKKTKLHKIIYGRERKLSLSVSSVNLKLIKSWLRKATSICSSYCSWCSNSCCCHFMLLI